MIFLRITRESEKGLRILRSNRNLTKIRIGFDIRVNAWKRKKSCVNTWNDFQIDACETDAWKAYLSCLLSWNGPFSIQFVRYCVKTPFFPLNAWKRENEEISVWLRHLGSLLRLTTSRKIAKENRIKTLETEKNWFTFRYIQGNHYQNSQYLQYVSKQYTIRDLTIKMQQFTHRYSACLAMFTGPSDVYISETRYSTYLITSRCWVLLYFPTFSNITI